MSLLPLRLLLKMQAMIWRLLMRVGLALHKRASPRPPSPSFRLSIPSRISSTPGRFNLHFYVPASYSAPSSSPSASQSPRYPVVVNFHGGGFTIGTGTDDARWAREVVQQTGAVVVSVDYRLAPEHPFPTGMEDGADAVLYLAAHAEELRLDPHRIVLSGFSSGGNFALTIPFLLQDLRDDTDTRHIRPETQKPSSKSPVFQSASQIPLVSTTPSTNAKKSLQPSEQDLSQRLPAFTLIALISFYPVTDFRIPRATKEASNPHPHLNLPRFFTTLFDASYLPKESPANPNSTSNTTTSPPARTHPHISPSAASTPLLRAAYPQHIALYTCEFDMLGAEGVAFAERLAEPEVGKSVLAHVVPGVVHAFDRKPNPFWMPPELGRCYGEVCGWLKGVLEGGLVEGEGGREEGGGNETREGER